MHNKYMCAPTMLNPILLAFFNLFVPSKIGNIHEVIIYTRVLVL